MLGSDAQKTFTLNNVKQRPLLIQSGFFKYTRNPNYVGEIMLYFAFVNLVDHWLAYAIVFYVWITLF